jgi:hypothetical protein
VSLDDRLRRDLERTAEGIVPDIERNLGIVEARAHPRPTAGGPMLLLAAAVIAAAIVFRFGVAPSGVGAPSPSVAPSPATFSPVPSAPASYTAIAGTYTVTLDPSNPAAAQYKLGGTWTMRLAATGEIFLSPPASFGSGTSSLSGLAFTLSGDRFRNNIFYNDYCSAVGTYTWSLAAGELRFAPVGDTCAIRQTLLSTAAWQASP